MAGIRTLVPVCGLLLAGALLLPTGASAAGNRLLDLSEKLDKADKADFDEMVRKADACTRSRNFACSESELSKAEKMVNSSRDKDALLAARGRLNNERDLVAREERDEEERQERQARAEEDAARAEQQRRNAESSDTGPTTSQIILGQLQRNIAEASAGLRTINRNAEIASEQAARNRTQQAADRERRQQEDAERRAAAARSSNYSNSSSGGTRVASASDNATQRAQTADRERERQREEREREQEKARQVAERTAREKANRERAERERAERVEREKAEKAAEGKAQQDYLRQMMAGVKLKARACPDGGEHKYYVVGTRPRPKPEVVSCIDVHYEAICEGSVVGVRGVAPNFVGAGTDCFFGDAATMQTKPACPVNQVRMVVREVRACGS